MRMNMLNIIYLNSGHRCGDIVDHRGYIHSLGSCENNSGHHSNLVPRAFPLKVGKVLETRLGIITAIIS